MGHTQGQSLGTPLARFEILRSRNCEEVVHRVSETLAPHRMELRTREGQLDTRMNRVEVGGLALSYIQHGVGVSIDTGVFEDRHLFFYDLSSDTKTEVLGKSFAVTAETAALYSPTCAAQITMGAKAKHLHLTLDRAAVEKHLETLSGVTVRGPIVFAPRVPPSRNCGALITGLMRLIIDNLDQGDHLLRNGLVVATLEDAILTALLTTHDHNQSLRFEARPPDLMPRQVRLVEDYIHANFDQPIMMKDFVALTNVSARSIHYAFRKYRGYSPKALLRSVRLERARERLLDPEIRQSVSRIALESGFEHLSRFSGEYRKKFGELPSQTLRKRELTRTLN